MLLERININEVSSDSCFNSGFWAEVKAFNGWSHLAFRYNGDDFIVLLKKNLIAYIPHLTFHGSRSELKELLENLKKYLPKTIFLITFDLPYGITVEGMEKYYADHSIQPQSTVVVDTENTAFHKRVLRNLKKNEGKYVISHDMKYFDMWYDIYLETSRRDNFTARSRDYIRNILEMNRDDVHSQLTVALKNDVPAAGIVTIYNRSESIYLYGGSLKQDDGTSPSYTLQECAIEDAESRKIRYYDMYGISSPDGRNDNLRKLDLFKTGFSDMRLNRMPTMDYPANRLLYTLYKLINRFRYHHI